MRTDEQTPAPWAWDSRNHSRYLVAPDMAVTVALVADISPTDAAFLCLAVNQHHALVAALKELTRQVELSGAVDTLGHELKHLQALHVASALLAQCERRGPP